MSQLTDDAIVGRQFDNYRVLRLLGQGSFARVYLAEHVHLHTLAALKVLLSQCDEQAFKQEARMLARLDHQHIIRVLEGGIAQETNTPFLVMAYAAHGTLRQRYPRGTTLPLQAIIEYVLQLADALHYAHGERIIHRDIKPENILLDAQDQVLLGDFGIALLIQTTQLLDTQEAIGTPTYMAPEQLRGRASPASDQYSLGVVVYEWLCGNPPFGGTPSEVISQKAHMSPLPLHERIPAIDPQVERVVLRALAKEPRERFSNIRDFAHALQRAGRSAAHLHSALIPIVRAAGATAFVEQRSVVTAREDMVGTGTEREKLIHRGYSRRTLLAGTAGLALGGGLGWAGHTLLSASIAPPAQGWTRIRIYSNKSALVSGLAWSPDNRYIASAYWDGTIHVWEVATGTTQVVYRQPNGVFSLAWSPHDEYIASSGAGEMQGSYDYTVHVWRADSGERVFAYAGHAASVGSLAWSPDGKRLASGSAGSVTAASEVHIWEATTGANVVRCNMQGYPYNSGLSWSPDGVYLAGGGASPYVLIWDAHSGRFDTFYSGHTDWIFAVAWSPSGNYLASGAGGKDKSIRIWDPATGQAALVYSSHTDAINILSWSPDGKRIASGAGTLHASQDNMVRVWTGLTTIALSGHRDGVRALAWSHDGTRLATGGDDGQVFVWQVNETGP